MTVADEDLYTIQLRRGDEAEWTAINPVLGEGEPGVEMDTNKFKLGDGFTAWVDLPYAGADPVVIQAMIDASHWTRSTVVETTAVLATLARESGTVALPAGYRVLKVESDFPARVRLYTTVAKRDSDAGRSATVDPVGDHGVVLDVVTTAAVLSLELSPTVDGYDPDNDGVIPITIDNLDTVSRAVSVTLTYVRTE